MDQIVDLMRRQDAVWIRRQFRVYSGPIDDFKINNLVYAAVLPPVRNSRKLHISWSGPLQITEIINQAMVKIKELNVYKPRIHDAHVSKLRLAKKMGERDPNPIFILPRLPKEDMLQLADELSEINLPCKVTDELVDEFYEDINHGSQHQDDDSSTGQIRSVTGEKSVSNKTEPIRSNTLSNNRTAATVQRGEANPQKKTSEKKSLKTITIYINPLETQISLSINQSINKAPEQLMEQREEEDLTRILQDEDETITEDQLTSAASEEEAQGIEPEKQKETRPELRITEDTAPSTATGSSGSGTRRSGRITKPVEKYDPSLRPRTPRSRTRPGVQKSLRRSGSSIVKSIKSALNEAWENTPQRMGPPSTRRRSRSRETRAASWRS